MSPIDLGVIVVYVVGCTVLGARLGSKSTGLKGYFLGESNIPAWAVMISIVATETSTATFLSVPGVAYKGDFSFLQLALGYILGRFVVATVLLPSYFRGEIYTAYEVLQERFGGSTRRTASVLFLITRSLADGLRLFLAALVLQQLTGWSISGSIVVVGVVTVVYTYLGGMKAVIWTDVIQFVDLHRSARSWRSGSSWASSPAAGRRALAERPTPPASSACSDFTFDLTRAVHVLGGPDRRDGAEHGHPRGRPDDGPALPLGPLAAAGRGGADRQRVRGLRPVRPLPAHRRRPLGLLPATPAVVPDQVFAKFIVDLPADRRPRPGHRGDLLRRDEHPVRLAELVGLRDRQRPVPPAQPAGPTRRTCSASRRA